jgi:hypothetical protein
MYDITWYYLKSADRQLLLIVHSTNIFSPYWKVAFRNIYTTYRQLIPFRKTKFSVFPQYDDLFLLLHNLYKLHGDEFHAFYVLIVQCCQMKN